MATAYGAGNSSASANSGAVQMVVLVFATRCSGNNRAVTMLAPSPRPNSSRVRLGWAGCQRTVAASAAAASPTTVNTVRVTRGGERRMISLRRVHLRGPSRDTYRREKLAVRPPLVVPVTVDSVLP